MTIRRIGLDTITLVRMYGVELDIPDDIWHQGEKAVLEWCKANRRAVNIARVASITSEEIEDITGVTIQ